MSETIRNYITPITGKPVTVIDGVESIHYWLVALHRLARLGKADSYGAEPEFHHKIARFDFSNESGSLMAAKWPYLVDAISVSIIYEARG